MTATLTAPTAGTITGRPGHSRNIDGVRAAAVCAVLAYHFGLFGATGGFLGVDMFFALSGYLITSLLANEIDRTGRVDLPAFIRRRVRRLMPAATATIAVVVATLAVIGTPTPMARQVTGAFAWSYNWVAIADGTSYFSTLVGPSPLKHFWSLAIEEQFYLVWPIVALAAGRYAIHHRRAAATIILAAAAASAWWMHHLVGPGDTTRVYFGTDTRVAGLLIGAAAALLIPLGTQARTRTSRHVAAGSAAVGTAVLAAMIFGVDDTDRWLYSGGFALAAAATVAVIVGAGTLGELRVFANRPVQWLGARSYGLYLWHWPIVVFDPAAAAGLNGTFATVTNLALSMVAAEMSWQLIEAVAQRRWVPAPRHGLAFAGCAALVVATVTVAPTSLDEGSSAAAIAAFDPDAAITVIDTTTAASNTPTGPTLQIDTTTTTAVAEPQLTYDTFVRPDGPARDVGVMLVGDSVPFGLAWDLDPAIPATVAAPDTLSVVSAARPGCSISRTPTNADGLPGLLEEHCAAMVDLWVDTVDRFDPDVALVVFGAWDIIDPVIDGDTVRVGTDRWRNHMTARFDEMVATVGTRGAQIVVTEVPCYTDMADYPVSNQRREQWRVDTLNEFLVDYRDTHPGAIRIAAFGDVVCPGGTDAALSDGTPLRDDGVHFGANAHNAIWGYLGPIVAAAAG